MANRLQRDEAPKYVNLRARRAGDEHAPNKFVGRRFLLMDAMIGGGSIRSYVDVAPYLDFVVINDDNDISLAISPRMAIKPLLNCFFSRFA